MNFGILFGGVGMFVAIIMALVIIILMARARLGESW